MAAANLTPRRRRTIILATPLADLDGLALAVDFLTAGCAGERRLSVRDLGQRAQLGMPLQRGANNLAAGDGTPNMRMRR